MTPEDFERQPRGPYLFNFWVAKSRVSTAFGEFTIEAHMPIDDLEPPDARMLRQAEELLVYTQTHHNAILDKIHEHYQLFSEDVSWLELCDVPSGLARDELAPYLETLALVVDREDPEPTIFVTPQWDEEHAIYMAVRNGRVVFRDP